MGMMSASHYNHIAQQVESRSPKSLLVFGVGYDAPLWRSIASTTRFVEDNPHFLSLAPTDSQTVLLRYGTRVGIWVAAPPPPDCINSLWDFVLIDGPEGHSNSSPGRQWPIEWSRSLAADTIFVHDYERAWDRTLCDRFLGPPSEIIAPSPDRPGVLAVFRVSDRGVETRSPSSTLLANSQLKCSSSTAPPTEPAPGEIASSSAVAKLRH